jgi:hypothetical protein
MERALPCCRAARPSPHPTTPAAAPRLAAPDAWHVKGADALVDASVAVSVRDARGALLEAVQETPPPAAVGEQVLR